LTTIQEDFKEESEAPRVCLEEIFDNNNDEEDEFLPLTLD
jgi:hypothetical protein